VKPNKKRGPLKAASLSFQILASQILEAISPIPNSGHSEQCGESLPRQPWPRGNASLCLTGKSRKVRKLLVLLYQCEIGKCAMFSNFIFRLDAGS
jgi:hypothetical protein